EEPRERDLEPRERDEEPRERDEEPRERDEEPRERDEEPRERDVEPRERDEEARELREEACEPREEPRELREKAREAREEARRLRPPPAPERAKPTVGDVAGTYKRVFVKGLATLLPTVVTLWVVLAAYNFINGNFASPITDLLKRQLEDTQTGNKVAVALFDL